MPGTLVLSTLSDGTNSTSATNAIQGSSKSWVNFNGVTTITNRASYNISSVTRNAAGDYSVTVTTAFTDANYTLLVSNSSYIGGAFTLAGAPLIHTIVASDTEQAPTTTVFRFGSCVWNSGTSGQDTKYVNVSIFR